MLKCFAIGLTFLGIFGVGCGGSTDSGLKNGTGGASGGGGSSASGGIGGDAGSGGAVGGAAGASGGAGGVGASGGAGGAGGSSTGGAGGQAITLDNVCEKTQPQGCALAKSCCQSSGFGYDEAGCTKGALASCKENVDEVKSGKMKFDPTKVDVCLSVYAKVFATCTLGVNDLLLVLDELKQCSYLFEGYLPQGASCDRDVQCAPSSDPDVFVDCDDTTKKCTQSKRLHLNANCAVGGDAKDFCAQGLYCDAAWSPFPPYPGVCKTATAEGQKCNGFKQFNLECGPGFYCNQQTSVCTKAKVGGANCGSDLECQSFVCAIGKCQALEPVVAQETCTG